MKYVYRCFDASRYRFTVLAPDLPELRVLLEDLAEHDIEYIPLSPEASTIELFTAIVKATHTSRFDMIHSHGLTAGLCTIGPSYLFRLPHLLTLHDIFSPQQFSGVAGRMKKRLLSLLLPLVDVIHAVGYDARDNYVEHFPRLTAFPTKLVVIRNGIDVEPFSKPIVRDFRSELGLPSNSFLIGFLGRFMSQKGFLYLVDALETVIENRPAGHEPVVLAFGEGGFIREEKARVTARGLDSAIRFLPFTPDISATLRGLDVVAMPSLWEACSLLAMEVLAAGVPLISTDCIGLRENVCDSPTTMIPTRDSTALADAILQEMRAPSRASFQTFRTEAVSRFDVRVQASKLEQLMLQLIAASPRGRRRIAA